MDGGCDFLLIAGGGFQLFHQIDYRAGFHRHKGIEHPTGHVRQRQETNLFIFRVYAIDVLQISGHIKHIGLRDHGTLRRARGARGIGQYHKIIAISSHDLLLPQIRILRSMLLTQLDQFIEAYAQGI